MAELSYGAIVEAVRGTPPATLLLSVLATALSFLALTFYDRSALQYAGAKLPYRLVAETSFIAFALSNTMGLGVLWLGEPFSWVRVGACTLIVTGVCLLALDA